MAGVRPEPLPLTDPPAGAKPVPPGGDVRLLGPAEVRDLLADLGLRPTKRLGQNFVIDPNTVRRIVALAGVTPGQHVLEIGPGLGSLTLGLLAAGAQVTAVEIDPVLGAALPRTVGQRAPDHAANLRAVVADALTLHPIDVTGGGSAPSGVVANLPYNVSVPVLLTVLERLASVETGLVMVQTEVAERLVAPPGSRTYGVPSVKAAWWAQLRAAGSVPRPVFLPVPNVDSSLVSLRRRAPAGPEPVRRRAFAAIDAAFAQRRKTLRAALAGWAGSAAAAELLLVSAGIDPQARGETLDVGAYARLGAVQLAAD